jgi:transposase InsO family protein
VRWHSKGFSAFWRWKSCPVGGRPQINKSRPYPKDELREPALGCAAHPRRTSETRLRRRPVDSLEVQGRPSQTWRTFLHNHADGIASIDLFVVPTIAFEQLFAFLVLGHGRRQLLWFAVTRHPTAEWLAHQITEAFPWDRAPAYIVRDNDRAFGSVFTRRLQAMGIRDRPTSFPSPWQNGYVERLIGSIRRECTDHLIVLNEEHPRRILGKWARRQMSN